MVKKEKEAPEKKKKWGQIGAAGSKKRADYLATIRKNKRNTKQINNTARMSARTLASGMMSGITSPARPWFRLATGDKQLDDITAVKMWLAEVQTIM